MKNLIISILITYILVHQDWMWEEELTGPVVFLFWITIEMIVVVVDAQIKEWRKAWVKWKS